MKPLFLFILTFCCIDIIAQAAPNIPEPERIRTYDVQHIRININFDWNEKKVIGNVETHITPLSDGMIEFEVDAIAFKINYVRDNDGKDQNYDYDGKKLKINLDKAYSTTDTIVYTVDYTCQPQRGLYFIYPTDLNPSLPYQIWTQGEAEDNRYWIPIYDYPNDKATTEMYVRVERMYETLSNGYLNYSKKVFDTEEKLDHWIMDKPHSTYLIMLAVGEYDIIKDEYQGVPIHSYVGKNINMDQARYSFRNTPAMLELFNEKFQYKYPWNKYAQVVVEDFTYGGMENTTATVLNKRAIYDSQVENDYTADNLISHELGHQWWGDLVTCKNWSEMWLNESFATYSNILWKEKYYNKDEHDYQLLKNGDAALKYDSVTGRYPIWAGMGSVTVNIYDKGSVILNTFKHILEERFFPTLHNLLKDNEYKNIVSNDFIDAINKTYNKADEGTGKPAKDFKWMFDQWIWKAGYPEFNVNYQFDEGTKEVILNINQLQKPDSITPVFRVPLDIRLKSLTDDKVHRVEVFDEDETFRITMNAKPDFVVFDYGNNILDKTFFEKSFDDWKKQLYESENAIDRIMALRGLQTFLKESESKSARNSGTSIDQGPALKCFEDKLLNDKFWGVRVEAAKVLGDNILNRTSIILKDTYSSQSDSRVKREILKALGNSKSPDDNEFIIGKIKDEDNKYIIADGINALSRSLPPERVFDELLPFMKIKSHRFVVENEIVEALDSANNTVEDERIKEALMETAFGIDIESRLRAKAITALKPYSGDEDVKVLAKKHIDYNFILVRKAIITLLENSKDKSQIQFLKDMDNKTTDLELKKIYASAIKKLEGPD